MDMAMSNGHDVVEDVPVDGASVASSEDYNNAPPSPSSLADEQGMTANGMVASTRPKEQTDRFGFTGGKQFTKDSDWNTPVQVIRRREIKWLDMLDDWDKWMSKKPKKVRERCRKGIPCSIRPRAWQYLCGSKKLYEQNKARWQEMDSSEGDPKWLEVIQKDLDRQFPFHEMFANRDGHGQQDLFRILKAYSIYNPRDGYCQAQAPVAAVLLMHMPAEDAFWALVQICEKYLTGYYSVGLEAVQIDGMVLAGLMKKESPTTHKHMKKHKIDPILYMTEWFMCMFSRTLPWPSVLRVWDMFFCEGVKVLFRVALVLLKSTLGRSEQLRDCQGLYETMEVLRNIPASITHEDFLAAEMLKLRVFEKDMEAEHCLSLARRKVIKERQLAPEKAAAMQRDIDQLRKKKRGKVKPPPNRDHREGFGSSDLLAQEKAAEQSASAQRPNEPMGAWNEHHQVLERTARAQSPLSDPAGGRPEMVREVHVDNPPKDWNRSTAESPVSPGPEKSTKSKDSKKEEKKKEKVEKKKGKFHSKTEVMSIPSPETVLGEEVDGTTEQKDDKDWHRGTGESPGSPGIEQPPKSKDSKKQEKKKEKVEKKKGKSHSKTEVMSIPSPGTVWGEEADGTTEQKDDKDWHRGTGESPGSLDTEKPLKSKDSKEEKKKEKVEKKKGKSHSKTELMNTPSPEPVLAEEEAGNTEQKDKKSKNKGKKVKKAEKGGKKNKEKASHSSSQPSSPLGSPDQEEPRRLSNGNDHAVKENVRSDNVTEALPEQIREYRLSPYAAVFHPETEPVPVVTGTNNTEVLPGIPTRSPAEEQQTSPSSRQASQHQDHHDDQSPQHFGLETPV